MLIPFAAPWAALGLTLLCAVGLSGPVRAESPEAPPLPAVSARRLDLADAAVRPLVEGLRQDLGPLLGAAQYRRHRGEPMAPRHDLLSVDGIAAALRAHRPLAYVVLGERLGDGDEVRLRDLYVLEGASVEGPPPIAAPRRADAAGRAGFALDLRGAWAEPLVQSLRGHLAALPGASGQGAAVSSVDAAVAALQDHPPLAFVVLAERDGAGVVVRRVFVVPDVLRLTIVDEAAPAVPGGGAAGPSGEPPEVQLVPGEGRAPPLIKFEFDPSKYEQTQ